MPDTVRIDPTAHALLREIAAAEHLSLQDALGRAVECYRRQAFLQGVVKDFAALGAGEAAEEEADRAAWDVTLADGAD
jgi:hypothetical protein